MRPKIRLSVRLIDLRDTRAACLPVQEEAGPAWSFILLQILRKDFQIFALIPGLILVAFFTSIPLLTIKLVTTENSITIPF